MTLSLELVFFYYDIPLNTSALCREQIIVVDITVMHVFLFKVIEQSGLFIML